MECRAKSDKAMNNQERFEHWMRVIIQHKDRASFEKMDKAMRLVPIH